MIERNPWVVLQAAKYHFEHQPVQIQVVTQEQIEPELVELIAEEPYVAEVTIMPGAYNKTIVIVSTDYSNWSRLEYETIVARACKRLTRLIRHRHEYLCGYWGREQELTIVQENLKACVYSRPKISSNKATVHTKLGAVDWLINISSFLEKYEAAGKYALQRDLIKLEMEQSTRKQRQH